MGNRRQRLPPDNVSRFGLDQQQDDFPLQFRHAQEPLPSSDRVTEKVTAFFVAAVGGNQLPATCDFPGSAGARCKATSRLETGTSTLASPNRIPRVEKDLATPTGASIAYTR